MLGTEHLDTVTAMSRLALNLWSQGQFKEAEELQLRVLEMDQRNLGYEHPETLTAMQSLAHTLYSQESFEEAVPLMENCVQLRKRILGDDHPHTKYSADVLDTWQKKSMEADS